MPGFVQPDGADSPVRHEIAANREIIAEYRRNHGQLGSWYTGGPLLLLHTVGAKSGQRRVTPVLYRNLVGHRYAVFAAHRGSPKHPAWYFNVLAHPGVDVELGSKTRRAVARVVHGAERATIWTDHTRDYPNFVDYEAQAGREIPVIVLEQLSSRRDQGPIPD